jgi:hypothetical protein
MVKVASRTFMVRTEKLLRDEKLGVIVVRLMIVMNDISITNSSMQEWQTTTEPKKRGRWRGGILYFGRIQSAHLFEALSIIKEISDDAELRAVVGRCDATTQQSFATVLPFLSGTDFGLMAKLRNNTAFHYTEEWVKRRMKRLVEKHPHHTTPYSMGAETLDWHFELGDLVIDEMVIRDIFQIPESTDTFEGATKVLDRLHTLGTAFTDFAGHFIFCCAR